MLCKGYDKVYDLAGGELIELRDVRGATLRVTHGTLWITQDQDQRDVVLRAGDVWTVERQGLTLAEAQGATTVCVMGAAAQRVAASPAKSKFEAWLAIWFTALERARKNRHFVPYF